MAKKKDSIEIMAQSMDLMQTHNPLMAALALNDKKNLFRSNVNNIFVKTGFHLFDYYFGGVINIHDELGNIIRQEPRPGQVMGTFNLFIGPSQSGKTTLAAQIAANIARQFPGSNVVHFDCEERFDVSRCETITRLPASWFDNSHGPERYMIRSGRVGLDVIQEMVVSMGTQKLRMKDQLTVPMDVTDEFGRPIKILAPTIAIIDSITTVMNETFNPGSDKDMQEAMQLRNNAEGARDAKTMKGFFKDVLGICKEANITIFGINHINQNMSMNSFLPVAKQQNYLKQEEKIPGGTTMVYLPHNIIKLSAITADDFREDSDNFKGHMVMVEPIKASSNQSGNKAKGVYFEMVFDQHRGFDPLRTLIMYGRDNGIIEGNRTRMKFKDHPDYSFAWKDLDQAKKEHPIWQDCRELIIPQLSTHLPFIAAEAFDEDVLLY